MKDIIENILSAIQSNNAYIVVPAKKDENVMRMGYVDYHNKFYSNLCSLIENMGPNYQYRSNIVAVQEKQIEELNILEISTYLTWIVRRDRFCEGHIASYIDNGILTRLLGRLIVLIDKKSKQEIIPNNILISVEDFIATAFSAEAKRKLDEKDKTFLVDYLLEKKAWKDAVIYERLQKPSTIIEHKREIIAILKAEITENISQICQDFDCWHKNICSRTDYGMRYGVWQKFINMTFKYLYCAKNLFPEFSGIWSKCHCPIDSIISKRLNEQLTRIGVAREELELSDMISRSSIVTWNNISEENYEKFQKQVQLVCSMENITPLEFDFVYWQK